MKTALITPFVGHLPLHPSTYLGYGAAFLRKDTELDIIDLNAEVFYKHKVQFKEVLACMNSKQVVLDHLDFYPFYDHLLKHAEKEFEQILWREYQSVFITTPSWFVTVPTENILKLSHIIKRDSPNIEISFFGNSLGSWTDENELRNNHIHIRHLNDLYKTCALAKPVKFDSLPTPIYENKEKYIFDALPFRLKHGCNWGKCRFCSLAKRWNHGYLERSAKKVIQEIEEFIDNYTPEMFVCSDNSINGKNLIEFCTYLENFDKPWIGAARGDLTEHEIQVLQRSNCKLIYFGLESGSDRVLREIKKGIDARQLSDFIKNLYDNNIMPAPSVFVGAPHETEGDFEQTIEFIIDHKRYLNIINIYPLIMTPNSDFFIGNQKPNPNTPSRLNKLVEVCREIGLKVCVGEQSEEYFICKMAYPGPVYY